MPKPKKNKAGLHKNVSSVLDGVPIPQGVRNWQPPDECERGRTDDSSAPAKSNISSVFKGVSVASGDVARSPAGEYPQDNCAEDSPTETLNNHRTSPSNPVKKPDCPEESSAKSVRPIQPEFVNKVARYSDPLDEAATQKPRRRTQNNFFAPREWMRRLLRHFSTRNG